MVTSSGDRDRWIVPGGGLEPNEDSSAAALREVMEEAGVVGSLARCLGSFEVCRLEIVFVFILLIFNSYVCRDI